LLFFLHGCDYSFSFFLKLFLPQCRLQFTGRSLFNATHDDTLDQRALLALASWPEQELRERVAVIRHRLARHLVSRLLQRDPEKRLSPEEALDHPFFKPVDKPIGRLHGETPPWDVFLS
jgi:serine/threonine protein kinase